MGRYSTPLGVEQAIKSAAIRQKELGLTNSISDAIHREYRNRFLSRVFSVEAGSRWILKGGTGMLARIHDARMTVDVDLISEIGNLDDALDELRQLSKIDLGDFFRFDYLKHSQIGAGENQPNIDGYRVSFAVYIGNAHKGRIQIDVMRGSLITGEVELIEPKDRLEIPKLMSFPYRLYPLVDQTADKISAVAEKYDSQSSSRVKDLVDLVEIALHFDLGGSDLRCALYAELSHRRREVPPELLIPAQWIAGYRKLAQDTLAVKGYEDFELACELVKRFVDPVLADDVDGKTWSCDLRKWEKAKF